MHFVLLASHSPEVCPNSNAKSKAMLLEVGPQIPAIAEKNGVTLLAGPFINREHLTVVVAEAERAEQLDTFILEARLAQWNTVRVIPSHSMEEGMKEMVEGTSLF